MSCRLPTSLLRRPSTISASSPTIPATIGATPLAPVVAITTTLPSSSSSSASPAAHQVRHATFVRRNRRPYRFTQLVQLSDGSAYTVRTTSPAPLYRSTKDSLNHALWQPSNPNLRNVEVDEAGKLAAFRSRFGRGWDSADADAPAVTAPTDASGASAGDAGAGSAAGSAAKPASMAAEEEDYGSSLSDLISGYASTSSYQEGAGSEKAKKGGKKK